MSDLSHWDGDGFDEGLDDDAILGLFDDLGIMFPDLDGMIDACKGEAWVHEKLAKYEQSEVNLAMARYFWRRVERLRALLKTLRDRVDAELEAK